MTTTTTKDPDLVHLLVLLTIEIIFAIIGFCIAVGAVVVGIKLSRRYQNVVIVRRAPAASPARAPAGNEKSAAKKSKKTSTTGGTKTEEEDPGLGA
ncbi:unnamed protein product [Caenorhabditis nigoni]